MKDGSSGELLPSGSLHNEVSVEAAQALAVYPLDDDVTELQAGGTRSDMPWRFELWNPIGGKSWLLKATEHETQSGLQSSLESLEMHGIARELLRDLAQRSAALQRHRRDLRHLE